MDAGRVGRSLRALPLRAEKRQDDVGDEAGCSRQLIGKIESGDLDGVTFGAVRRVTESLGGMLEVGVRWRGEGLDRLLDAAHAGLVEELVQRLRALGWETAVEVSFNIRGERGSVDVMALRRDLAIVVVVEVKSVVPDAGPMLFALDRKARLAPEIARSLGWPCRAVGKILVVGATTTARRRIAALAATFQSAFPVRGVAVRAWLRRPKGPHAGLWFLPYATRGGRSHPTTGRQRVRRRGSRAPRCQTPSVVASGADPRADPG